jgi:NADH-quinone oxidoreductase subunit E/NADP-reducing hydrogenase subunit HndA
MSYQPAAEFIVTEHLDELNGIYQKYRDMDGNTIPILQDIQETFGYLPEKAVNWIADRTGTPRSTFFGIATFYSFFSMTPKGKHNIKVCMGTACYVKSAEDIINNLTKKLDISIGEVTSDMMFSLESVRCLGACGLAPVVVVNSDTFGSVHPSKASRILSKYKKKEQ